MANNDMVDRLRALAYLDQQEAKGVKLEQGGVAGDIVGEIESIRGEVSKCRDVAMVAEVVLYKSIGGDWNGVAECWTGRVLFRHNKAIESLINDLIGAMSDELPEAFERRCISDGAEMKRYHFVEVRD